MIIAQKTQRNRKANPLVSIDSVKRLEGWLSFKEAGKELGYSKQGMHRLIFESPRSPFNVDADVRGVGERPLMLVREEAVMAIKARLDPNPTVGRTKIKAIPAADD